MHLGHVDSLFDVSSLIRLPQNLQKCIGIPPFDWLLIVYAEGAKYMKTKLKLSPLGKRIDEVLIDLALDTRDFNWIKRIQETNNYKYIGLSENECLTLEEFLFELNMDVYRKLAQIEQQMWDEWRRKQNE
jgi:hypothetical protein